MTALFESYKSRLNTFLFMGIFLAVPGGYFIPEIGHTLGFIGELFLRSLSLLIVPVIIISMLSGILQFNGTGQLGKVGLKVVIYYCLTTALAVATGLVAVNLLQPGLEETNTPLSTSMAAETSTENKSDFQNQPIQNKPEGGIAEVIKKIIPSNFFAAAHEGNVLGLIFFTTLIGIGLLSEGERCSQHITPPVEVLFSALIKVIDLIMLLAPVGVFALVFSEVARAVNEDMLVKTGYEVGSYFVTVMLALLFHAIVTLPLILKLSGRSPLAFVKDMLPALTTAFSTASSAATLPITIESLKTRAKVPNKVASFVAPLGATVNMDGTAMYESIAAVFIANMYGMDLSLIDQMIIFLTATFGAIGAAGIPGAGLIMMTMVLASVGIPAEGIGLVVIVDRLLDMFRTSINVWGDCIGAAIIAKGMNEGSKA